MSGFLAEIVVALGDKTSNIIVNTVIKVVLETESFIFCALLITDITGLHIKLM